MTVTPRACECDHPAEVDRCPISCDRFAPREPTAEDRALLEKIAADLDAKRKAPKSAPAPGELTAEERKLLAALRAALSGVEFAPTHEDAIAVVERLAECTIDLEWHSERCRCGVKDRPLGALELVGIGGTYEGERDSGPFRVCQLPWQDLDGFRQLELREAVYALIRRAHVIYQNAIGDIKVMRRHGFELTVADHVNLDDIMLADAVVDSELAHDLGDMGIRRGRLPHGYKALQYVAPREYNAGDLLEPINIWRSFEREFAKDPAAEEVYREQSLAYLREIQLEQEEAGIRIDKRVPYVLRDLYSAQREQAIRLARAYTGGAPFSLSSPDDLKHFLFVVEGLPEQREKSYRSDVQGKLTTDKDAIAELRRGLGTEWDPDDEPTLEDAWANGQAGGHTLLEARYLFAGAQQALSHYVLPCFELGPKGEILGIRDRLYSECRIHVQSSGRHSYVGTDDPGKKGVALQQLKGPLEEDPLVAGGKIARLQRLIVPDPGQFWGGHDWSNIETWLLGGLADDKVILDAKANGWDTHVLNFCDMTGTPYPPILTKKLHDAPCTCEGPHDLTALQAAAKGCPAAWRELLDWKGDEDPRRVHAKRFVYRLHYRGKPENATDIPGSKALKFDSAKLVRASESYLYRHPALPVFWAKLERQADRTGVVYTFLGRPRRLRSEYRNARNREASNHPLQGGVADIYVTTALEVKRAMPWARLVYGAHDSMLWSAPIERRDEFREQYRPIVERAFVIRPDGFEMNFPGSYKEREAA